MYKLSIIIPIHYNLNCAFQNVRSITNKEVEFLFVGESNGKLPKLKNYRHINKKCNIYKAMNIGLSESRGEYVYFKGATDIVIVQNILDSLDGTSIILGSICIGKKVHDYKIIYKGINYIHHQAFLSKRDQIEFDENYSIYSDLDHINKKILVYGDDVKYIKKVFCHFNIGGTSSNGIKTLYKFLEFSLISRKYNKRFYMQIDYWKNIARLIWYKIKAE